MAQKARVQQALEAIRENPSLSFRKAARLFDVPRSTLQDRFHGKQANKISKQFQQRLTVEEEASIERCLLQMALWGWPITVAALKDLAKSFLQNKNDNEPLGHSWYKNFLARHPDLKIQRSRCMDQNRRDASDPKTLQHWFNLYQSVRLTHNIIDEDVYNMDEKGCIKGIGDNAKVIISRYNKEAFSTQPGNREWVSIIEYIEVNRYPGWIFVKNDHTIMLVGDE